MEKLLLTNRAQAIQSLFSPLALASPYSTPILKEEYEELLYSPIQQQYGIGRGEENSGNNGADEREAIMMDPHDLQKLEWELRRRNPDLLDKLRFAMGDRQYGVLAGQIARGAFWAGAIYSMPFLVGPLIAARAIQRSRLKQISRRDLGIKPRYHLRPDDRY